MEINGSDIYNRIVEIIQERKIKTSDFYNKIGITRQNFSKWKSGSIPSFDVLYLIKEELNVSWDWLLNGTSEQDTTDIAAPFKIVNRIDDLIEKKTNKKKYEANFHDCIKDIISENELSGWFTGRQNIDISKLSKIADKIETSVQYLITGYDISIAQAKSKRPGDEDSEYQNFYQIFSQLDEKSKNIIKDIAGLYYKDLKQSEK